MIALQILLVLGGVELGLRWLGPGHRGLRGVLYQAGVAGDYGEIASLPELMERSMLGYRPLETHRGFVLNSRSFRTREFTDDKDGSVSRVLALGDSFTYGAVPFGWTWPSRLEELLADRSPESRVELLNLGVPGTGIPFQIRLWELVGSRLEADLVVLLLFVGNDLVEGLGGGPGWDGTLDKLATVSHTVRVIRNLWRARTGKAGGPESGAMRPPTRSAAGPAGGYELPGYEDSFDETRPSFTREAYLRLEAERMEICRTDERLELALRAERVADMLEALAASVEAQGARFLVVLAPDEYQVDEGLARDVAAAAGTTLSEFDLAAPQRELRERLARRGIELVDLLPALRAAAEDEEVYLPRDTHWNRAGNLFAAREIAAALSSEPR